MNDTLIMSVLQSTEYLSYKVQSVFPPKHALLLDKLFKGDAVDIFHNDKLYLVRKSHIIYLYDIRVRKYSDSLALVSEASEKFLVL